MNTNNNTAFDFSVLPPEINSGRLYPGGGAGPLPSGADDASAAIAALFASHAQEYQALGAQTQAFHDQFVNALSTGHSDWTI